MKAITLHQPYASLIAEGVKTIETRSWAPPKALIGQRIAIHAGKQVDKYVGIETRRAAAKYLIPRGAIVATAQLWNAGKVIRHSGEDAIVKCLEDGGESAILIDAHGDFSVGRWLWLLEDIQPLAKPIPARGYQGFWEWER